MHERRHYRDADRAQHLLPGNAFDRLGEREAKQRADRVQLERERKREQWRDRLTDRRQAWQKKPAIEADKTYQAKPGQPVVYRWTAGNAAGLVAVKDYGDRIVPSGKPDGKVSNAKIVAMLTVAQEKGWKEVTFTGPQEFRERCAAAAVKRGLKLADEDLAKRFAPKIEKPVSTPERQRSPDKPIAASQSNTPAPVRAAPRSWYHPENIANREAQALQNAQQKAADAEQWQARIKKLSEQGKIMEYTRRIEVELQAKNAKAAAELRDKADLLAEQVASGEKSPAVLKTANEHVRNAELLERIAAEPLNRPAAPALDSIQGNDIQLADHFEKLIGWIRSTGGEHQKIPGDGAKSEWEGRFVKVDDQFAVQNVGKKHVIHILSDLDKKPLEGSKGNVLYGFDGKAKVTIQPDLTPVKGKGGIAD